MQTLRIYDLDHVYERNPDEAAERMREQTVREPHPDGIFALCEMHYLRGQASEKKRPADAIEHYYRACGYAQHYLLASCDDESKPAATFVRGDVAPLPILALVGEAISCIGIPA